MESMFNNQQEAGSCSFLGNSAPKKQAFNDHESHDVELAREMNELSVKERENVLDEIHGVAQVHEETPEFIAKCLEELDVQISKVPKAKRRAHDRAIFFRPTIQTDTKFKLMFLRADTYDAEKAAKRMIKYFEDKLQLFGEEKLARDIRLDDLSDEDMSVFSSGWCLELPHKDQVGRPIWFFDLPRYDFDRPNSMLRCCWYMMMVSLKDETAQTKGVCDLAYAPGNIMSLPSTLPKVSSLMSKGGDILMNLPMRITSYHFCYNDTRMQMMLSIIRRFFGKQVRLRLRTHFGSDLEMQYSLTTFGIPSKFLIQRDKPDGIDRKKQLHQQYIQRRREIERAEEQARVAAERNTGDISYPQPNDVLIGRGRPYQEYSGNQRFGGLIDSNLDLYHKCSDRFGKTCLSMDIVKTVQEYGGRFIERSKSDAGGWKVIDDVIAREKTAIGFRSRVSKVTPDKATRALSNDNVVMAQAKRPRYNNPSIALYS